MNGFKEGLKAYPELKLLDENYIVTNWNPADAQKATAGLIAQYPQIDAIASDCGVTSLAATKAFLQAGLPVPAMSALATSNEYNCLYLSAKAEGKAWKYLALDGSTADVRAAREAFETGPWRRMKPKDRAAILYRIGDLIDTYAVELAELDVLDEGSPWGVTKNFYIALSADHFRYFAGWATKIGGETLPVNMGGEWLAYTTREPIGGVEGFARLGRRLHGGSETG